MIKINILSSGFTSPNGAAFLCPLILFKKNLESQNFKIKIKYKISDNITNCDYLLIDSKYFKHDWDSKKYNQTLGKISSLSEKTKIIWCDQADSTGTFLGQVLPFVHRYLKAQLLKDKKQYMKNHYASRIFTDYYHRKYGIEDKEPYITQPAIKEEYLDKLKNSWNSCFMHYGLMGPYILRIREKIPLNAMLHFSKKVTPANSLRTMNVTCRMGIPYSRDTICFQRNKMRDILSKHLQTDKLSRREYLKELEKSKICISPFGLGEITLKDFECFLSGSLLLKPDMSHMETWPNLYEDGITYISHKWDLSDLEEKIDWAQSHEKESINIAQSAQDRYIDHTIGKNAGELFTNNFKNLIREFSQ